MVTDPIVARKAQLSTGTPQLVRSQMWQVAAAIAAWLYIAIIHRHNDGLWYLGDSTTHAANGAFWWEIISRLPHDPLGFALSYYSRYPIINPTAYPPVFYLVEGVLYRIFGISPYVPRALVLACALMASLYLVAWIRRWISEEVGWFGTLFILQPAIVVWSNAVMLNVPSTAMAVAALYHTRRWIDEPKSGHVWGAGIFGALAILMYPATAVVVVMMLGLILAERRLHIIFTRQVLAVSALAAAAILPWAFFAYKWAPGHRRVAMYMGGRPFWELASWLYYPAALPKMISIPVLCLLGLALVLMAQRKRRRFEAEIEFMLLSICYVWFSIFSVKEQRYALLLVAASLLLTARASAALLEALHRVSLKAPYAVLTAIMAIHVPLAAAVRVPRVSGFKEVVAYVDKIVPRGWIFYSGDYDGVFGYYLQAGDRNFSRGMVRSSKLLYVSIIEPRFMMHQNVRCPADVIRLLHDQCGCRYMLIERGASDYVPAERYLREALRTQEFRLLRSFRVVTPTVREIDLYQYLDPGERPQQFEMAFPEFGENAKYRIGPIQR
jgi:hypothetical protein